METVEISTFIYDKMQTWACEHKELFLQSKYTTPETRSKLWDHLNQEFNQFIGTLPDQYQRQTPENMAIAHLYTLYTDNPELLPDEIEVRSKSFETSSIC